MAAVLLVAVVVTVGSGVVLARWSPISRGDFSLPLTDQYRDGSRTRFAFSIRNTGRWSVTITAVSFGESSDGWRGLLTSSRFLLGPPGARDYRDRHLQPFAPFRLNRGEERAIWVDVVFGNCEAYGEGSGVTYDAADVTHELLGVRHTQTVEFAAPVSVAAPPDALCPRERRRP